MTPPPALVLLSLALLCPPAAAQEPAPDPSSLAELVRGALQNDPRNSAEALRLEQQRLRDLQLAQIVNQRLVEVRGLTGLVVSCHDGLVELRGRAPAPAARERASALALGVVGVSAVINGLRLPDEPEPAAAPESGPTLLYPAIEPPPESIAGPFGFATADGLAGRGVRVDAREGIVRLRGEVNSDDARLYASVAAHSAPGVRAVRNELAVVRSTVEQSRRLALLIGKQLDYDPIVQTVSSMVLVTARDGIVRLEGRVQDAAQLQRALDLASIQVGVFAVDNRLEIDEQLTIAPTRRGPYTAVLMR